MQPSISVIIPAYNRAHCIGRALDSVAGQSLAALEIIVVDDGSTDRSRELISSYYPLVRLLNAPHRGVSSARNLGIAEARGDWIALLDSDDSWLPDKLECQYRALMENREYRIVHSNELWIRNGKPLKQLKKHRKSGGYIFPSCLPRCVISPSSVMLHRDVFAEVGLFDEDLPVCEDYDLWLRVCSCFPVLFLEQPLITKYGGHEDQLSRQYQGMDLYRIRALAKILANRNLKHADRDAAIQMLLTKIAIYSRGASKHGNHRHLAELALLLRQYSQPASLTGEQVVS